VTDEQKIAEVEMILDGCPKFMRVGDLRQILEGVPGDLRVRLNLRGWCWLTDFKKDEDGLQLIGADEDPRWKEFYLKTHCEYCAGEHPNGTCLRSMGHKI
jgi:hypothetical protein